MQELPCHYSTFSKMIQVKTASQSKDNKNCMADFSFPFILNVDTSSKSLGCALYHKIDDWIKILGFGCKTLNITEQKYHSSKLEILGLKMGSHWEKLGLFSTCSSSLSLHIVIF